MGNRALSGHGLGGRYRHCAKRSSHATCIVSRDKQLWSYLRARTTLATSALNVNKDERDSPKAPRRPFLIKALNTPRILYPVNATA